METQNIKQRIRDEPVATADENTGGSESESKGKRTAIAKRGLKTLGMAVSIPVLLTLTDIYFFGTASDTYGYKRPNWVPPVWALHMACLGSAFLMGLCGWMVWAEGGFHRKPRAVQFYLGQFGVSLLWSPLVFRMGANWAGLGVALGLCWALFQCHRVFREVNQTAADLMLPCLGWAGLLAFVNLKFLLS